MEKSSYTLAISVSHNSTAALMRNGEIIVAVCEERSLRKKNYLGYPKNAIDYCLKKAGIASEQLSNVAFTTKENSGILIKSKTVTEFTLKDYWDYYGDKYYKKRIMGEETVDYLKWLRDAEQFNSKNEHFDFTYLTDDVLMNEETEVALFRKEQSRALSNHLGIDSKKIKFLDHHTCHAYYAYFGSPFRGEECIVLTLDGWGDGRNQTVWKVKNEKFELLADSSENDIGRIYKMATLLLGMRPDEHEFKVMGLAPYAKESYVKKARKPLDKLSKIENMKIIRDQRPDDLFSYLEESWKYERFDNIAGAVQSYTEDLVCALVQDIHAKTGIRRFVLGGGIAMNIKMNKAISELNCVDEIFVCGSSGDESLSIGGCYLLNPEPDTNKSLSNMYLGFDVGDEIDELNTFELGQEFNVNLDVKSLEVAQLIANGDVIACIQGRAEFGARALGNRSILADPRKRESVQRINEAIKNRDFWMPFALSILKEKSDQYIINPKNLESPHMAISLDVDPTQHDKIIAGTHPYDKTVRPQFVEKTESPAYHSLISNFEKITGIPALLNTSFNLHGEPIVDSLQDALRTFRLSGLDHLFIENKILISKR
jgi:carbamoyltransferase